MRVSRKTASNDHSADPFIRVIDFPHCRMYADSAGVELFLHSKSIGSVRWDEITRVAGYKHDMFTTDVVCVAIHWPGTPGEMIVNEEMTGFGDFQKALEDHLRIEDTAWFAKVSNPAFEPNYTVLYEKLP